MSSVIGGVFYVDTVNSEINVLLPLNVSNTIVVADYVNFGGATGVAGSPGYGIRDDNGSMEYSNANGTWNSFDSLAFNGTTNSISIQGATDTTALEVSSNTALYPSVYVNNQADASVGLTVANLNNNATGLQIVTIIPNSTTNILYPFTVNARDTPSIQVVNKYQSSLPAQSFFGINGLFSGGTISTRFFSQQSYNVPSGSGTSTIFTLTAAVNTITSINASFNAYGTTGVAAGTGFAAVLSTALGSSLIGSPTITLLDTGGLVSSVNWTVSGSYLNIDISQNPTQPMAVLVSYDYFTSDAVLT